MAVIKDHPRIRGEHADVVVSEVTALWITPAYAGNTAGLTLSVQHMKDHPRIRGEHLKTFDFSTSRLGSPPHTRGTPFKLSR